MSFNDLRRTSLRSSPPRLRRPKRRVRMGHAAALAVVGLSLVVPTAASATAPRSDQPGLPGPNVATGRRWLIAQSSLTRLRSLDPALAQHYFDSPVTFVLGAPPKTWIGIRTESFTSEAAFAAAASSGRLASGVRAVVYDNEAWSFTPAVEQRSPASYEQAFAIVAHRHGLLAIMSPALDLVGVLHCSGASVQARYLSCGLAASAARAGDVVDIQAQRLESNPAAYASFVTAAATQARSANRSVSVLAGLTTGTSGGPVTAGQLAASARATSASVNGWWLNVPTASTKCPLCGPANPTLALQFLRLLGP